MCLHYPSHACATLKLPGDPPPSTAPRRVACAPYGGPLATVRDERLVLQLAAGASLRPVVRTFTCAGRELGSMVWERGSIVAWGWTERLELVIVESSGKVSE